MRPRLRVKRRLARDAAPERGASILELVVAASLMLLALSGFFRGLVTSQQGANFAALRQETLDDLRITADTFAKDARQASAVLDGMTRSRIDFRTYLDGVPTTVTYEAVESGGVYNLERREGGLRRTFVVSLQDRLVFDPDSSNAAEVRTVRLLLSSQPDPKRPPVLLETEVALRNVDY